MTKAEIIKAYKRLMLDNYEDDVWKHKIEPKLDTMTYAQILKQYRRDKKWYASLGTIVRNEDISIKNVSAYTCCICGESFVGYGNNPAPITSKGRCCNKCNSEVVIPARLLRLQKEVTE